MITVKRWSTRRLFGLLLALCEPMAGARAGADGPPLPQFSTSPVRVPETMQRVTSLEFSPDGKYLLSGHGWFERSGSYQVWDVATGRRVAIHVVSTGVSSVGWMPKGDRLAYAVWDNFVRVVEFSSQKQVCEFKIDRSVGYLAVSPNSKQIVTVAEGHRDADESPGRVVQIWDAQTGELIRKCDSDETLFRLGCTAWSPKGKYVAGGGGYYGRQVGLGRLWFADTGKEVSRLEGHTGYIRAIRFFPDDMQVATSGLDGTVRIWESATGKQVARFMVGSMVDGLAISTDGKLLASGGAGGEIALWSPEEKQKIADLSKTGSAIHALALSRNAKLLAAGSADGIVRIWNVDEKKLRQELPLPGSDDRPGTPLAIVSLRDGQVAVAGYDTGVLMATDVTERATAWRFDAGQGKSPIAIAVSADEKKLLVGYEDGALRIHSAADGKVQKEVKKLTERIVSVAIDNESGHIAAGDAMGNVFLWEQQGKVERGPRHDHSAPVLALGFGDKGNALTSISADGSAICRATTADETLAEARVGRPPLAAAVISQDGSTAVVLGPQLLTVWNALPLTRRSESPVIARRESTVAISSDGRLVVHTHALGTSMFEGTQGGQVEPVRTTNSREGGLFALSSDQRTLLQATTGGAILAWHALPPKVAPLAQIPRAGNAVAVATSPDGKWLVSGGDDSQATVWDFTTGEIVETLPGNFGTMYAIAFSNDSAFMATANMTGSVKVWRVKDWSLEGVVLNPDRHVRCVAFSPNGRWLASGRSDRKLVITDTESWETAVETPEQDLWVEGAVFSPDGTLLYTVTGSWAAGDQPATAMLTAWKAIEEKDNLKVEPIKKIKAHGGTVDNVVVSPNGRQVITAGADSLLKVWDAETLDLVRAIKLPAGAHRLQLLRSDPSQALVGDHLGGVGVWNIETGRCLASYAGHTAHVFDVTATMDGRLLITASEDDRLLFWPGPNRGPDEALKKFLKYATDEK